MIQSFIGYKSQVVILDPKNSTKRCSRCGLRINRQLNAAINLYLQMEGLSQSPRLFEELMRGWSGFTQTGEG
jgi:putative transposase